MLPHIINRQFSLIIPIVLAKAAIYFGQLELATMFLVSAVVFYLIATIATINMTRTPGKLLHYKRLMLDTLNTNKLLKFLPWVCVLLTFNVALYSVTSTILIGLITGMLIIMSILTDFIKSDLLKNGV